MKIDPELERRVLEAISSARKSGLVYTEKALTNVLAALKSTQDLPEDRYPHLQFDPEKTMPPQPLPTQIH